jgi:hypothetical protein
MISVGEINNEFLLLGHVLFVDTDGALSTWGLESRRQKLLQRLAGREEEMKRFLTAQTLRGEV